MPKGKLSRDEVRAIIKEAQTECRAEVPIAVAHKTPAGRTRTSRDRAAYLNCLRTKIVEKIKKKLTEKGFKVV